jgi:GTP cyclohydrolase I
VMRAWSEMTIGYNMNPAEILDRTFDETSDEMVVVRDIEFHSNCEHHMLPFSGTASVGYLPGDRVVGLSKIPRLVECFAKRLQVQERMTKQIATAMQTHLQPLGVAVVVNARHSCMGCRGVRQSRASMTTSTMLGKLRTDVSARAEFLALIR